jgi:hypothetical protein
MKCINWFQIFTWWPRQIPNTGLIVLLLIHDLMVTIVSGHWVSGSPGPLLKNRPSNSRKENDNENCYSLFK